MKCPTQGGSFVATLTGLNPFRIAGALLDHPLAGNTIDFLVQILAQVGEGKITITPEERCLF